jgi:hypothetical protein
MGDGLLSVPVSAGGQVQIRLAPVADRDVFDPAGWRHKDLQPTGAGWFERLCGLAGVDLGCGRHVMRLELIQRIPRTGLADPGPGTVGPAAGLVVQRRRNGYAVPAGWVIACVVLVAARSRVRQR